MKCEEKKISINFTILKRKKRLIIHSAQFEIVYFTGIFVRYDFKKYKLFVRENFLVEIKPILKQMIFQIFVLIFPKLKQKNHKPTHFLNCYLSGKNNFGLFLLQIKIKSGNKFCFNFSEKKSSCKYKYLPFNQSYQKQKSYHMHPKVHEMNRQKLPKTTKKLQTFNFQNIQLFNLIKSFILIKMMISKMNTTIGNIRKIQQE